MALSERARSSYARRTRDRRDDALIQWRKDRDAHLQAVHYKCEIGPILAEHGLLAYRDCQGRADTCHHGRARGMGGSRDNSILFATCPACHSYVEANPMIAETVGVKVRHGM